MKYLFSRYSIMVAFFLFLFAFKTQAQTGPTNDSLYIVGAGFENWSNPIPAADVASQAFTTVSPTEYKINVLLVGGSEYKFIAKNGSWGENWGIAKADDPTEVNGGPFTSGSQNILAPAVTGIYTIDVNFAINIFTVKLASLPKVTITSFSPTSAGAGTTDTIRGTNFTGATSVSFGGDTASSFTVWNDSTITAVVGKGASGTVQVIAPNGTGVLGGFTFNSNMLFLIGSATLDSTWTNPIPSADSAALQFTTISPTEYKITAALIGGKEYKFLPQDGSWALSYGIAVQDDPTEVNGGALTTNGQNIMAPATSGNYIIDVNLATNTFTVTAVTNPNTSIASFSPLSADSGTTVTIKGIGFTGATAVSFGGTAATSFAVVNDTTITAVVSNGASGSVQVVDPNGTVSLAGFTFITTPVSNTLFIVGSATANGWNNPLQTADSAAQQFTQVSPTEYKITTHLIGDSSYKFIPTDGSWATTYGIAIANNPAEVNGGSITSTNAQNILAPSLSGTYTIDVNLATSTFTVTLVSPDALFLIGSATANGWQNPLKQADSAVQEFSKVSATQFKLTVNLYAGLEYKFLGQDDGTWVNNWGIAKADDPNEVNGGPFIFGTSTQNIAAPAQSGAYTILVDFATDSFTVTLDSLTTPTFTSFSPTSGDSGTVITLKGSGFTGTTAVGFGSTAATSFTVVNDSTITAVVSNGASGTVIVVTPNGIVTLDGFTYIVSTNSLYIVGSATANGWNNPLQAADSAAQTFTPLSTSVFTITTHLTADSSYKFLPTDNGVWTNSYGVAIANNPAMVNAGTLVSTNSQNILAPALSGTYTIVVNLSTNTFTTTLVSPDNLYIVGNATANGWNNPLQSADSAAQMFGQFSPTEDTLTVYLYADSSYKFIAQDNGNWTYNWGVAVTNDPTMVNQGTLVFGVNSKNILSPSVSGWYTIDVDFAANVFYVNSTLPVKLAAFNAAVENKTVQLDWLTATELNTSHFSVQHSTNGSNFAEIGSVKAIGAGANSYKFTDLTPAEGVNYYRLQSVDKNGSYTYSKVVSVNFAGNTNKFAVYPTLTHDGNVSIRINEATAGTASIKVIDLNGRILQTSKITIAEGSNLLPYKITAATKGTYIVNVETATGKQAFKVIVE